MTNKSIYENQWYVVVPKSTMDGYSIINKHTGVTEGGSEKLPSTISQADAACKVLIELQGRNNNETTS